MPELLAFTRMTGDLVKAMRACPQPIVAAIDGVCAGAGAILAMASDLRLGTARSKTAFLFTRVGLAGCDMGACAILPRIIGQGRAAELLYTGRAMSGEEGERWGFFNRLVRARGAAAPKRTALAHELADGPTFAHGMTKTMLHQEWTWASTKRSRPKRRRRRSACRREDFRARLSRLRRRSTSRVSKATECIGQATQPSTFSTGLSSTTRTASWRATLDALGRRAR